MNAKSSTINVAVNKELHKLVVAHIQETDGKIGKFTEKAIKEKLEREAVKRGS